MKSNSFNKYWYLLYILLTTGCMVGKRYSSPAAPSGITYHDTITTDTTGLMGWTELYHDTVLQRIIKTTLNNNKDLLAATSRIEEARAQAAIIRANLYPSFNYQGQAGGGRVGTEGRKVSGGYQGTVFNGYGTLNWELDLWGKLRRAKRSALLAYLSDISTQNALKVSLIAEVASQYFLLRDLDNRLQIGKMTLESRQNYNKIISEKFDKGYVPETDKLMAVQQESEIGAAIPSLERQIIQTENSIRNLMGELPGRIPRGASNFEQSLSPDIPVGIPSQLLQRRPDILAAEQALHAQYEQIGVAQANRFPSIGLTGLLGFASPQLSTLISNSGFVANGFGAITGPIFNFNQLKNRVKVEQKRTEQLNYQYQQTVLGAFTDVDNSLTYVRTYAEEYSQWERNVKASEKALTLSNARYNYGFTSFLEVLIQQDNLFNAQLQQSVALQGKLNATVMLYKSLGGGWQ